MFSFHFIQKESAEEKEVCRVFDLEQWSVLKKYFQESKISQVDAELKQLIAAFTYVLYFSSTMNVLLVYLSMFYH